MAAMYRGPPSCTMQPADAKLFPSSSPPGGPVRPTAAMRSETEKPGPTTSGETGNGWSDRDDFTDAIISWADALLRHSGSTAPQVGCPMAQYLNYHERLGAIGVANYPQQGMADEGLPQGGGPCPAATVPDIDKGSALQRGWFW